DSSSQLKPNTFNRVIDADLVLRSKDNRWYHSSFLAKSFDKQNKSRTMTGSAFFQYSDRNLTANLGTFFVGKNFNAEVGFDPEVLYILVNWATIQKSPIKYILKMRGYYSLGRWLG
ncbi:MAG: hypothetical protein HKN31_00470, partial [Pricia sp.]|nr:hypothetical protein [Pricia sp.]